MVQQGWEWEESISREPNMAPGRHLGCECLKCHILGSSETLHVFLSTPFLPQDLHAIFSMISTKYPNSPPLCVCHGISLLSFWGFTIRNKDNDYHPLLSSPPLLPVSFSLSSVITPAAIFSFTWMRRDSWLSLINGKSVVILYTLQKLPTSF